MPKKIGSGPSLPKKIKIQNLIFNQFYTKFDQIQYATLFQPQQEVEDSCTEQ